MGKNLFSLEALLIALGVLLIMAILIFSFVIWRNTVVLDGVGLSCIEWEGIDCAYQNYTDYEGAAYWRDYGNNTCERCRIHALSKRVDWGDRDMSVGCS